MVRRLVVVPWWQIVVLAVLVVGAGVVDAANTSRPTGRGAERDESVYCQNWPGHSSRPAYRGTGPQNPFGADCRTQPAPPPQPPLQDETADACPLREASALSAGIVLVASGADVTPGLWVAGHRVLNARQVGLGRLTQRRKEIFEAMRCSRTRAFRFADAERLRDTIELRAKIIERMEARVRGNPTAQFGCGLDPPRNWEQYPEPKGTLGPEAAHYAVRSLPGVSAHAAVEAFRTERSVLDCHAGIQLTVLDAADEALGAARFDRLHPKRAWSHFSPVRPDGRPAQYALVGLGVALLRDEDLLTITLLPRIQLGPFSTNPIQFGFFSTLVSNANLTSLAKHLLVVRYHLPSGPRNAGSKDPDVSDFFAGRIKAEDMVPGDWAYLKNVPDYETFVPTGAFAGENAFYIRERTTGDAASRVFFGFGLESLRRFVTEGELRQHMADDFNRNAPRRPPARPEYMVWTRLGSPLLDDSDLSEAGLFVR